MNAYFFKMTQAEKNNILDQHKSVYDGYVTNYVQSNQQPLYVQDLANDKNGITINNKGDVGVYRNMNINEDIYSGAKFEPETTFESEEEESYMVSMGEQLDMIGDSDDDLEHGTFSHEDEKEPIFGDLMKCKHCGGTGEDVFADEECEFCGGTGLENGSPLEEEEDFYDFDEEEMDEEIDEEIKEQLKESIDKTIDMFRRFKNY